MNFIFDKLVSLDWWTEQGFIFLIPFIVTRIYGIARERYRSHVKPVFRRWIRSKQAKSLRKIKAIRWNALEINLLISKATASYLLFVAMIVFYFYLILLTPTGSVTKSVPLMVLLASPIYCFQIRWLILRDRVDEALKSRRKIECLRDSSAGKASNPGKRSALREMPQRSSNLPAAQDASR